MSQETDPIIENLQLKRVVILTQMENLQLKFNELERQRLSVEAELEAKGVKVPPLLREKAFQK